MDRARWLASGENSLTPMVVALDRFALCRCGRTSRHRIRDDDGALARLAIAATRVDPRRRRHASENRALLISSIARGRRWLNELIADPTANAVSIARRDGCSVRKVNMTISLAFLAPDLVKAAIDERLPHGMGVVRLADLRAEWSRQHQMLGLSA
jgi:hypothetical protein